MLLVIPQDQREEVMQCQVLDIDGKKCKRKAVGTHEYHGDRKIYDALSGRPGWVRVYMCRWHDEAMRGECDR